MPVLSTVKSRDALKARHAPYWQQLRRGCHLGFRKVSTASAGSWVARFRDEEGKQHLHSLGSFEDVSPGERFDLARTAAEKWFGHMGAGGRSAGETVTDACRGYLASVGESTRKDAQGRFNRWVFNDAKFSGIELLKLKHSDVKNWRKRLESTPTIRQDKLASTKSRSPSSVNRDMATLRAALNWAVKDKMATSDIAWKDALAPLQNADKRRNVYIDREARKQLIAHAQPDLAPFLRALCNLPLRPGAVASLTVGDFQPKTAELTIGSDKSGQARRIKLPTSTATLFSQACKDKTSKAPIFGQANGKAWEKDAWKYSLKAAVKAAKLPDGVTAYTLRHSTITDLLSLHGLDTLTVAALAGTSLAMIEKHYGHLLRERAADALGQLAI